MSNFDNLLADASQLPVVDRIQLIDALWDTLPEGELPPLSAEWVNEIQRRSAEFDAGSITTIPWEEIRADALKRIGRSNA